MGQTGDCDAAFWLPAQFLTDEDFLVGRESFRSDPIESGSDLGGSKPSDLSSPESEREEQDELLTELTLRLTQSTVEETFNKFNSSQKTHVFSTSPQSTLSGVKTWTGFAGTGSPNGSSRISSPPSTPPPPTDAATWEVFHAVAGQVARSKLNTDFAHTSQNNTSCHFSDTNQPLKQERSSIWERQGKGSWYSQHPIQHRGGSGHGHGGALGLPQRAWLPVRSQHHHHHHHYNCQLNHSGVHYGSGMRPSFMNGSGSCVKRQSTGTGVFLPRRPGPQAVPRKEPSGCSTVVLPVKVFRSMHMDLEKMNHHTHSQRSIDILRAKRNAIMAQQKRISMFNHEIHLPQDWTY